MAKWSEVWKDSKLNKAEKANLVKELAFKDIFALPPKDSKPSKGYPHLQGFQIGKS